MLLPIKYFSNSIYLFILVTLSIVLCIGGHNYLFNENKDKDNNKLNPDLSSEMSLESNHFVLSAEFQPYTHPLIEKNFAAIVISIFTLLGIFSKALLDYSPRGKRPLWKIVGIPLLISPIIINPTFSVLIEHPDGFAASLMAYQNGFFWQTLTESFRK